MTASLATFLTVLSLLLLLSLSLTTTANPTPSLPPPSSAPHPLLPSNPSLLTGGDDAQCPSNSPACNPELAWTLPDGESSAQSGCWACAHGGSCDAGYFGGPGVYCGQGSGQLTLRGQVVAFTYLAFCCGVGEHKCTPGFTYKDDADANSDMSGYACVREASDEMSLGALLTLGILAATLLGLLTVAAYAWWKRTRGEDGSFGWLECCRRGRAEGWGGGGQQVGVVAAPAVVVDGGAAAAHASAGEAEGAERPFRPDPGFADPSAYQRME